MQDYLVKLEASDGQIYLYEDRVTIARDGLWAKISHGFKPHKDIIFKNINSIDFQKAGFSAGSFTIHCIGATDIKDYSLKFMKKNNEDFEDLKEKIIQKVNSLK